MKSGTTQLLTLLLLASVEAGCDSSQATDPASGPAAEATPNGGAGRKQPSSRGVAQAAAQVELSATQVASLEISPVSSHPFAREIEAVGSVGFEEDPGIVQAESTLLGASATLRFAEQEVARLQRLGPGSGIPQRDIEKAIADFASAQAAFRASRDSVRILGVEEGDIDRLLAAGQIETPEPGRRWVVARIHESDIALVRPGQAVHVTAMAVPDRTFVGTVSRVYGVVDPATHRTAVRCEIADPDNGLRPGMLVDVIVAIEAPSATPAVPPTAVARETDGSLTAWVTTDRHSFARRMIKTGLQQGGQVQVLEGLAPGELVVADGGVFLSNMLDAPPSD
jgi:cobalt-zinc-cadmium efflux system membrane fusion protein